MPVTPFHFGPGLLAKALVPFAFSWLGFCVTNVLVDLEVVYRVARGQTPVHGPLHTALGGTLTGIATALLFLLVGRALRRGRPARPRGRLAASELSAAGLFAGAVAGGLSHPFLDAMMHADVRPFMPWHAANPLHGAVSRPALLIACVAAGAAGVLGVALWRRRLRAHGESAEPRP